MVWRMDHNIRNRQRLFLRFSYWNISDLPIDPLGSGLCADRCSENYHSSAMAAGYTHTFTPTVIFGFNVSVSRFNYNRSPKNSGFDLTTVGWPSTYNQSVPAIMRTPPTPCVANFADNIICTQGQSFIQDRNTQYNLSPSFLSLFTSLGTLLCCALPSLLVLVGLGATVASVLSQAPWLVSMSHHKHWVFLTAGLLISAPLARHASPACQGSPGPAFLSQIFCSAMPTILTTS